METASPTETASPAQKSAPHNGDLDIGTIAYWGVTLGLLLLIGSAFLSVRGPILGVFFASGIGCLTLTLFLICISASRRERVEREHSLTSGADADPNMRQLGSSRASPQAAIVILFLMIAMSCLANIFVPMDMLPSWLRENPFMNFGLGSAVTVLCLGASDVIRLRTPN